MQHFKKTLVLVLLFSQLLTGCIPVALVAGATAGGVAVYDRRSLREGFVDREITRRCLYAIRNTNELDGRSHISVATENQVVLLVGQAQTPELKALAKQAISNVPNIKKVYNEIQVSGANSMMNRTSDSWMTTKVKTAMLREKNLKSSDIKVVTEAGTVYLMGRVTRDQADLATRVARRVGGVKMVVKVFQYQQPLVTTKLVLPEQGGADDGAGNNQMAMNAAGDVGGAGSDGSANTSASSDTAGDSSGVPNIPIHHAGAIYAGAGGMVSG